MVSVIPAVKEEETSQPIGTLKQEETILDIDILLKNLYNARQFYSAFKAGKVRHVTLQE